MARKPAAPAKGKPRIVAAMGARGTGKSAWASTLPEYQAARLVVWDLMREAVHAHLPGTDSLADVIDGMRAARWRVAFYPSADDAKRAQQFELLCSAAYAVGGCTLHVEELAFVTTASRAPPAWRRACLLGRHKGVSLVGTSQRPAQVDKEFLGNADLVHTGRLMGADAQVVARVLGVKPADLEQLPDLAWLEREGAAARAGNLSFVGGKPRSTVERLSPSKAAA